MIEINTNIMYKYIHHDATIDFRHKSHIEMLSDVPI